MSPEACNHVYMDKCVDELKYYDTNSIDYISVTHNIHYKFVHIVFIFRQKGIKVIGGELNHLNDKKVAGIH